MTMTMTMTMGKGKGRGRGSACVLLIVTRHIGAIRVIQSVERYREVVLCECESGLVRFWIMVRE